MPPRELIYWIKFPKSRFPVKIVVYHYEALRSEIDRLVLLYQEPFDWIISG